MNPQAILVYPGLGKTTLAMRNNKFADVDLKEYIGRHDYPNFHGAQVNSENMLQYSKDQIAAGKTLLLVFKKDSIDLLNKLGITDYAIVLPDKTKLEEVENDQKNRGKDPKHIIEFYEASVKEAKDLNKQTVFLQTGIYLGDVV